LITRGEVSHIHIYRDFGRFLHMRNGLVHERQRKQNRRIIDKPTKRREENGRIGEIPWSRFRTSGANNLDRFDNHRHNIDNIR